MQDTSQRTLSMGRRVEDFTTANAASFPAGSRAALLIISISAAVQALEQQGSAQDAAVASGLEATQRKQAALANLRDLMRPVSETARAMEKQSQGISARFRMPRGSEQAIINRARAIRDEAAAMTSEFTGRGLPATFLTDLDASIASVESASDAQDQAQRDETAATAAIAQAEQQLIDAVRELSPIVRNIFRNDAAKLASWESASRTERAPRKKKTTPAPPQP
jgi:hypothetical protein